MKRGFPFVTFLSVALIILSSCATGPDKRTILAGAQSDSAGQANQLVIDHVSLTLPPAWRFRAPVSEEPESVLFRFHDPDQRLIGTFEYIPQPEKRISMEELISFYEESVFDDTVGIKKFETVIDGNSAVIMSGIAKKGKGGVLLSMIAEENQIISVEVAGERRLITEKAETISEIFHSYRYIEENTSKRVPAEGVRFHSFESEWQWYDDLPGGVYLQRFIDDEPIMVGVAFDNTNRNIASSQLRGEKSFSAPILINNRRVTLQGYILEHTDRRIILVYEGNLDGVPLLISCATDHLPTDTEPETFHRHEMMKNLFRYHLLFYYKE
jgi:hypothetical protein